MMTSTRNPKPFGSAIWPVLEKLGVGKKVKQGKAVSAWASVVGEQIARVTRAERMREGKLVVHVEHATWRNELIYLKQELIDKLNAELGQEFVKDIIFK
jgi:predicted nucleic acid-binding Zn ribbon protein